MKSSPAADQSLEITLEIRPEVRVDRVPMRSLVLHFRNLTNSPLRLYLPQAPEFRANISTVYMVPEGAPPLGIPEPHPHGYVVTEADFPELAPGQARDFEQPFTIDPFSRTGANTERRAGFEPGRSVRVSWTYENSITRWQGGIATLDGPTRMLFDGGKIPNIWTGKLEVEMRWTIPS